MKRFWSRTDRFDLEYELRTGRPRPRPQFVHELTAQVEAARSRSRGRSFRVAFASVLSVGMLVSLASFGGFGYAASAVEKTADSVKRVFVGKKKAKRGLHRSAAADQYAEKVLICHIPPGNPANAHTIFVSSNAVPAHLRHGDTLGVCP
jgi:hypothetical protein